MNRLFDRVGEDLGDIVAPEHVNVTVLDQAEATPFYPKLFRIEREERSMRRPLYMQPLNSPEFLSKQPKRSTRVRRRIPGMPPA
jgi:hypothetical protein